MATLSLPNCFNNLADRVSHYMCFIRANRKSRLCFRNCSTNLKPFQQPLLHNKLMKTKLLLTAITAFIGSALYAVDVPPVGSAAPDFSVPDANGKTQSLSQ